jgi:hypothetical protein
MLKEILHWAICGLRPCASNSFLQNTRAKKPLESSILSGSITQAPAIFPETKTTFLSPQDRGSAKAPVPSNHTQLWNGDDEAAPPATVFGLLFKNLLGKIPRK